MVFTVLFFLALDSKLRSPDTLSLNGITLSANKIFTVHRFVKCRILQLDANFFIGFKECCWSCFMQFTRSIFSFTQNLASVLSDPSRSRSERLAFFTRHWGESFIPKTRVSSSPSLPNITVDHFKNYLATTAKVRNMYLFFHASRIASKQLYFVVEVIIQKNFGKYGLSCMRELLFLKLKILATLFLETPLVLEGTASIIENFSSARRE